MFWCAWGPYKVINFFCELVLDTPQAKFLKDATIVVTFLMKPRFKKVTGRIWRRRTPGHRCISRTVAEYLDFQVN